MPVIHPTLPSDGDDAIVSPYNTAINAILAVINGAIDSDNLAAGAVTLAGLAAAVQAALVPTGSILPYGGSSAPTGFLMCDGSSQLRASYSALFAVVGTNYGTADGTHFNVPDLRGRVPVGSDTMGSSASNIIQRSTTITTTSGSTAATVGSASDLSVGMYIVSTNVAAGTTIAAISGTSVTLSGNATGSGTTVAARFSNFANDAQVLGAKGGHAKIGAHTHTYSSTRGNIAWGSGSSHGLDPDLGNGNTTTSTGGGPVESNIPPSLVTYYIIKT